MSRKKDLDRLRAVTFGTARRGRGRHFISFDVASAQLLHLSHMCIHPSDIKRSYDINKYRQRRDCYACVCRQYILLSRVAVNSAVCDILGVDTKEKSDVDVGLSTTAS